MIYALMTSQNTNRMNVSQFMAGVSRYGVENPTPVIKKRIALFGNTDDVISLLKKV
jgi:hypothetical protein